MTRNLRRHDRLLSVVLLGLLVAAAVLGVGWTGWLEGPENLYGDLWHRLAGIRYQPQEVVIVALDEATLQDNPEPLVCWTPHFARVIEVLRRVGAKIIGLDYLFQVSIETWLKTLNLPANHPSLQYDGPFIKQLSSGQVILGAHRASDEHGRNTIILPIQEYVLALPNAKKDLGLINFFNDADGVIRRFVPGLADADGQVLLTLAKVLTVRAAGQDPGQAITQLQQNQALQDWSADDPRGPGLGAVPRIGFVGPPHTFRRVSMGRFLTPAAEQDEEITRLKDKVVIIAYEPEALQDAHPTPYALSLGLWPGNDMSGPEIHANIVETLRTGVFPRQVPVALSSLYLLGLILAGSLVFYRLPPLPGLAAGLVICILAGGFACLLFYRYWLLPTADVQLGVMLSYMGILGLKLTGEEREKARVRKIFSRYVAQEVVETLLASGKLPDLGGEVFQVTVLFADIRNFTTISERLAPHEVVEMLNGYLSQAGEAILGQGGTVDKYIGDAIMAIFGAPVRHPDHARRALRAALELAEKATEFRTWMKQRFDGLGLPKFAVGIGLHTGEAIVGNIGSTRRLEYTAIGDTVNAASRLESLTKEVGWTIVASQSTIAAAPGVETGRQETRKVKGRQEPLEVYEVLGLHEPDDEKSPDLP
jgi:adenylate cyclase